MNPNDPGQTPLGFSPPPSPLPHERLWAWYQGHRHKRNIGIGCGVLFGLFVLCVIGSIIANAMHPQPASIQTTPTQEVTPSPIPSPNIEPTPTSIPPTPKPF